MRINLIGLPGSGKTTIGELISELFNLQFIDLDKVIDNTFNKSPNQFITDDGLDTFRAIESAFLKESVDNNDNYLLSTGGGIVERELNKEFLRGITIYLKVKPEILKTRNIDNREIIKIYSIEELSNRRDSLYEDFSNVTVENNGTIQECFDKLIKIIGEFYEIVIS